jgi:hypothetical protein
MGANVNIGFLLIPRDLHSTFSLSVSVSCSNFLVSNINEWPLRVYSPSQQKHEAGQTYISRDFTYYSPLKTPTSDICILGIESDSKLLLGFSWPIIFKLEIIK